MTRRNLPGVKQVSILDASHATRVADSTLDPVQRKEPKTMLAKLDFKAAVAAATAAAVGTASSTPAVYKTGHDGFLQ